jgi:NitT/TauT family transport system substrate-binding protein
MRVRSALLVLVALLLPVGCGGSDEPAGTTLRLGYFANVTHAGAVYGVKSGRYQSALGATTLKTQTFNAGPAAIEALFAGAIDATYVGPGPAVNAFIKSKGAVVVVAGATSGGASLVVRPGITEKDLRGKRLADPQVGGTQDIALRTYLKGKGLEVDKSGSGDVTVQSQENSQTLDLFTSGDIDGAWVPEPWASRLVIEGKGTVLVDERSLWPGGAFPTTVLLVRKDYLAKHRDVVTALIRAQVEAHAAIRTGGATAQQVVNDALEELTGKALAPAVVTRAFSQIELTEDPLAAQLKTGAEHAFVTGLVKSGPLEGIVDLSLVREVTGKAVDDAGLGKG